MTDTVIPNDEVREAARDLIESLKADGYTDQSVMAELQQLADGHPMPKKVTNEE
jgi:disulfide oxidoreductase YuzD